MSQVRELTEQDRQAIAAIVVGLKNMNPNMSDAEANRQARDMYFAQAPGEALVASPEGAPTEDTATQAAAELRLAEQQAEAKAEQEKLILQWIEIRTNLLMNNPENPMDPDSARRAATAEAANRLQATPSGFGTPSERQQSQGLNLGLVGTLVPDILPDVTPESNILLQLAQAGTGQRDIPTEGVSEPRGVAVEGVSAGLEFNWPDDLKQQISSYAESLGVTYDFDSFKKYFYDPILQQVLAEGIEGPQAIEEAVKRSVEQLYDIRYRLQDTSTYLRDDAATMQQADKLWWQEIGSHIYPDILLGGVEVGRGVPALTAQQREYIQEAYETTKQARIEEMRANPPVREFSQPMRRGPGGDVLPPTTVSRPMTDEEIVAEVEAEFGPLPEFITDFEMLQLEQNQWKRGWFTNYSELGSSQNRMAAQMLQNNDMLITAVAGAVGGAVETGQIAFARDEEQEQTMREFAEDRTEQRNEVLQQFYNDPNLDTSDWNPIFANMIVSVYTGKTGMEEALEISQGSDWNNWSTGAAVGAGFIWDIVGPDFIGSAGGIGAGISAGYDFARLRAKMYTDLMGSRSAGQTTLGAIEGLSREGLRQLATHTGIKAVYDSLSAPVGAAGRRLGVNVDTPSWLADSQASFTPRGARESLTHNMQGQIAGAGITGRILADAPDASADAVIDAFRTEGLLGNGRLDNMSASYAAAFEKKARELGPNATARQVHDALPDVYKQGLFARAFETGEDLSATKAGVRNRHVPERTVEQIRSSIQAVMPTATRGRRAISGAEAAQRGAPLPSQIDDVVFESPVVDDATVRGVMTHIAAEHVWNNTANMGNTVDNLVQMTNRTWVNYNDLDTINRAARNTPIGKLSEQLSATTPRPVINRSVSTSRTGEVANRQIVPAFNLSDGHQAIIKKELTEQLEGRTLSRTRAVQINDRMKNSQVITEADLAHLMNNRRDAIAEGMGLDARSRMRGILRESDMTNMPINRQRELLEPIETRSFARSTYNKWRAGKVPTEGIVTRLSLGQKQMLNQALQETGKLHDRLRTSFSRLADPKKGKAERELYGVRDGASYNEIVSHLVVGPGRATTPAELREIEHLLEGSIGELFVSDEVLENVFDMTTGAHASRNTHILTDKGLEQLDLATHAQKIAENPNSFFFVLNDVAEQVRTLVSQGSPEFLRYRPNTIDDIIASAGKIPESAQVGAYFRAEARRIQFKLQDDLVESELIRTGAGRQDTVLSGYDVSDAAEALDAAFPGQSVRPIQDVIKQRFHELVENGNTPNYGRKAIRELFVDSTEVVTAQRRVIKEQDAAAKAQKAQELLAEAQEKLASAVDAQTAKVMERVNKQATVVQNRTVAANKAHDRAIQLQEQNKAAQAALAQAKRGGDAAAIKKATTAAERAAEQAVGAVKRVERSMENIRTSQARLNKIAGGKADEASVRALVEAKLGQKMDQLQKAVDKASETALNAALDVQKSSPEAVEEAKRMIELHDILDGGKILDSGDVLDILPEAGVLNHAIGYLRVADDIAQKIVARHNMDKWDLKIDDVNKLIDGLFETEEGVSRVTLMFGSRIAEQLQNQFKSARGRLNQELADSMKQQYITGMTGGSFLNGLWNAYLNARYFLLLTAASRFQFANLITAPDILYSTTGYFSVVPRLRMVRGAEAIANRNPYKVMFTTDAGVSYTQGKLHNMMTMVGRSIERVAMPDASSARLTKLIDEKKKGNVRRFARWSGESWMDTAENVDSLNRYAVMERALMQGRTESEAIKLAQRGMYDPNDLFKKERALSGVTMFYGWQRQNLLQSLINMLSPIGNRRIKNAHMAIHDLSTLLVGQEREQYAPDYLAGRILLDAYLSDPENLRYGYWSSPEMASISGHHALVDIAAGDFSGALVGLLGPGTKTALGVTDDFTREYNQVPPEYVHFLAGVPFFSTESIVNAALRFMGCEEPVVPRPSNHRTAVDGYVYPLVTQEQKDAFGSFVKLAQLTYLTRVWFDYSRTIGLEGTSLADATPAQRAAFFASIGKSTGISKEKLAYYNTLSQNRELAAMVSATRRELGEFDAYDIQTQSTPEDMERAERAELRQARREERRYTMDDYRRATEQLRRDVASLKRRYRNGELTREQYAAEKDELKRRKDELVRARANFQAAQQQ